MESLKDKVAIITGASSGCGRATAILFAKYGCKLVLTSRNEQKLNDTLGQCDKENTVLVVGDVNDAQVQEKIVKMALEKFGKIDVLVNNAGITSESDIFTMSERNFDTIFDTNLKSVIFLTQKCAPHLVKQKGVIVNVSSLFGTHGVSGRLAYCISKAALDQFTKCISLEFAPKQVRVNSVNPGAVVTNIAYASGIVSNKQQDYEFWKSQEHLHPLGRNGSPEEVAQVIGFLASDQSSFITGELVHVDGGRHLI